MNRRTFLKQAAVGSAAVAGALALPGCGDSSGSVEDDGFEFTGGISDGSCATGTQVHYIPGSERNHGHNVILLSPTEMAVAEAKDYVVLSGNDHDHTFPINAADFAALENGQTVTKTGGVPDHGHTIEIRC